MLSEDVSMNGMGGNAEMFSEKGAKSSRVENGPGPNHTMRR
jgi:hypothetical protein